VSRLAPLKLLERNRRSGTIGDAECDSQYKRANRTNGPQCAHQRCQFDQTKDDAAEAERSQKVARPIKLLALGVGSTLRDFPKRYRQDRQPQSEVDENTNLQERCSVNHPPSTGPIAAVIDVKPDQVPIARPRSACERICANQSQTARDKQCASDSLDTPVTAK
jgi:hypothetical protein